MEIEGTTYPLDPIGGFLCKGSILLGVLGESVDGNQIWQPNKIGELVTSQSPQASNYGEQ